MSYARWKYEHPGAWKKGLTYAAVFAVGMGAGPIAGKVVGIVLPKALERVSDTPITDLKAHESPFRKEAVTHEPKEVTLRITARERATLAEVAGAWGIEGRLRCAVVKK